MNILVVSSSSSVLGRGGGGDETNAGASMAASIFNLVNNVAGAGMLTLAAGKARGTGWVPAVAIVCLLGWAASTTFRMIAESCELTGESDFKGIWGKTLGDNTKICVDVAIMIQCFASTVVYAGILGDVWTPIFKVRPCVELRYC